jgi:hypothetical protein
MGRALCGGARSSAHISADLIVAVFPGVIAALLPGVITALFPGVITALFPGVITALFPGVILDLWRYNDHKSKIICQGRTVC